MASSHALQTDLNVTISFVNIQASPTVFDQLQMIIAIDVDARAAALGLR
jgi:hypothetical protein